MCPRGALLLAGEGGLLDTARMVAHCLLIEAGNRLLLVDTGFGSGDAADPGRLGRPFRAMVRPRCEESETAVRQIEALGLDPAGVTDIVVTHLDVDHAGGLGDFPAARVHVFAPELAAARSPSLRERSRYASAQWAHGPVWTEYEADGDAWFGFRSVRAVPDLDAEIAMVPLLGHSRGHTGIAVREGAGWLLHCGDAYFHRHEVATPPSCPPGLRLFQTLAAHDARARSENLQRLRDLARQHSGEVRLICSHDAELFDREAAPAPAA